MRHLITILYAQNYRAHSNHYTAGLNQTPHHHDLKLECRPSLPMGTKILTAPITLNAEIKSIKPLYTFYRWESQTVLYKNHILTRLNHTEDITL